MKFETPIKALTIYEETVADMQSLLFEVELLRRACDLVFSFDPNLVENALDRNLQQLLSCVGIMEELLSYFSSRDYVVERYEHFQAVQEAFGEG